MHVCHVTVKADRVWHPTVKVKADAKKACKSMYSIAMSVTVIAEGTEYSVCTQQVMLPYALNFCKTELSRITDLCNNCNFSGMLGHSYYVVYIHCIDVLLRR